MGQTSRSMLVAMALLGSFALVGTVLVALVFTGTAERIADNERALERARLFELLADVDVANDPLHEWREVSDPRLGERAQHVYLARDAAGQPSALVYTAETLRGYNGRIALLVAVRPDGTVLGARVTAHRETPGLGDAIERERSPWIDQFIGRSLATTPIERWTVRREGGDFDQFTGATITPRAVVQAVRNVLLHHQEQVDDTLSAFAAETR